jgi:hypothetical protein
LSTGKRIGCIGLVEAGENTDYFLHTPILRRFFDFGGRYQRVTFLAQWHTLPQIVEAVQEHQRLKAVSDDAVCQFWHTVNPWPKSIGLLHRVPETCSPT